MAYVIGDDCVACGTCIDECPVGAISEAKSILLIRMLALSAVLALVFAHRRLSAFRSNSNTVTDSTSHGGTSQYRFFCALTCYRFIF